MCELRVDQRVLVSARRRYLVPAAFLLGACIGELLTIRVDESASTVVEAGGIVGELLTSLSFAGFDDLSVSIDQELANQGVAPGDVESVHIVELEFSTPDGADLSFLSEVSVYVSAPGLDTVLVAFQDTFPEGVTTVALELPDEDLTAYVEAESMTLTVDASGELPEEDTTIDVALAIDVEATPQGACAAIEEG